MNRPRLLRLPRPLASLPERTPLRVKLVATVLVLAALGLAVAGTVSATALHSYLLGRVDAQLVDAAGPATGFAAHDRFEQGPPDPGGAQSPPGEFYVVALGPGGAATSPYSVPLGNESPPRLADVVARATQQGPFTVASRDGSTSWRVLVRPEPGGNGSIAIATSLSDLTNTVGHLVVDEVLIGAAVLLVMAGGGYLLIRRSLQPLVDVEHTAAAIAAGDLSQRVPEAGPRTEVGRLSSALNGMLAQIERAFAHERESRDRASASEHRMRQFVADASHELRTPLTSIRGFAELHRMGAAADPDDVQQVMRRIEDESARMGVLVEDLLLLARLDQQRPLEREPVDLLEIARDAVQDAQAVAPGRDVTLSVDAPVPPVVTGDELRLRQVVRNLMANALTHTPDGTAVAVRVATATTDGPARAIVEVADSGHGIPEEDAERIFERFYRSDPSRSRAAGGTGLGLSIVAGLVAAHGGRVEVDSQPGAGATFRVVLPLAAG